MHKRGGWLLAAVLGGLLAGCGGKAEAPSATAPAKPGVAMDEERVLNIYNWTDYIVPDILSGFENEYGIKINYDVFDSNEVVETKLLAGNTGYDIVVPSASFMQRQITAGAFQKLDKSLLSNLGNLDPEISRQVAANDPGNQYGVNYFWGTDGVGYNAAVIKQIMPDAPVDSLRMFYDPNVVKNFQKCGVTILDAPDEVVGTVLIYLGRNPDSESTEDLKAAEKVLLSIRPYIRYINSSKYIEDLANGEICLSLGWSGDVSQAKARAREAGKDLDIRYSIPKEGSITFYDTMVIPIDAPHPKNAHLFINYMMRPENAARNSSMIRYATGNSAAYKLIDPKVYNDPNIFPPAEMMSHLHPNVARSQTFTRELNRTWTRFKTGQ
ncbi:MAG TPA: polyamine ABC transporter substrate-binding protein [Steroidobacteraceae bacterium]